MPKLTEQEINLVRTEYNRIKKEVKYFPLKVSELYTFYRQQTLPEIINKLNAQNDILFPMLVKNNRKKLYYIFKQILDATLNLIKQYLQNISEMGGLKLQKIQQIITESLPDLKGQIHISDDVVEWYEWKYKLRILFKEQFNFIQDYYQIIDQKGELKTIIYQFFKQIQSITLHTKSELAQRIITKKFSKSIIKIEHSYQFDVEELYLQKDMENIQQSVIKQSKIRTSEQGTVRRNNSALIQNEHLEIRLPLKKMKSADSQTPVQQKTLELTPNISEQHCLNLQKKFVIVPTDEAQILSYALLSEDQLKREMGHQFHDSMMSIIRYSIEKPIKKLKLYEDQFKLGYGSKLLVTFNRYQNILSKSIQDIKIMGESIPFSKQNDKCSLYKLIALFYKSLRKQYTVITRHYLRKVCLALQTEIQTYDLRSALKMIQQHDFQEQKRSVIAKKLSRESAYRSPSYQKSEQSLMLTKQYTFPKSSQMQQDIERQLRKIQKKNEWPPIIPDIEFIKLNMHSPSKISKIVNFAISGYLSENTAKDLEWQGLIRAIGQSSELYGVRWPSSTLSQTLKCILKLGAKFLSSLFSFLYGETILKYQLEELIGKENVNTFTTAYNIAKLVGQYIADFLIINFSDRFINLIAFSLGTVVVFHCLKRLSDCGKLHLINRVITLGGVADQEDINELLKTAEYPLFWTNIKSSGDIIVRGLFKLYSFGTTPIGAGGIPPAFGHQIVSLQMGEIIGGHLDFRCYLQGIGSMTALHFD